MEPKVNQIVRLGQFFFFKCPFTKLCRCACPRLKALVIIALESMQRRLGVHYDNHLSMFLWVYIEVIIKMEVFVFFPAWLWTRQKIKGTEAYRPEGKLGDQSTSIRSLREGSLDSLFEGSRHLSKEKAASTTGRCMACNFYDFK